MITVRATCFLSDGKESTNATPVAGELTWAMGSRTGANLDKKQTVTPFWHSQKESALIQKGREGTVLYQINFHYLALPQAAHILHLIPNAHGQNSTNTEKEILTPQPLCFLVGYNPSAPFSGFHVFGPGV